MNACLYTLVSCRVHLYMILMRHRRAKPACACTFALFKVECSHSQEVIHGPVPDPAHFGGHFLPQLRGLAEARLKRVPKPIHGPIHVYLYMRGLRGLQACGPPQHTPIQHAVGPDPRRPPERSNQPPFSRFDLTRPDIWRQTRSAPHAAVAACAQPLKWRAGPIQ